MCVLFGGGGGRARRGVGASRGRGGREGRGRGEWKEGRGAWWCYSWWSWRELGVVAIGGVGGGVLSLCLAVVV